MAGLPQADTGLLQHPPGSSAGHATGFQQGQAAPVLPPPASHAQAAAIRSAAAHRLVSVFVRDPDRTTLELRARMTENDAKGIEGLEFYNPKG